MSSLEIISPSRSSKREDSTSGQTPLTKSAKINYKDTATLLVMASKRVCCSPFLPTTESDSYRERERESEIDRQRERA